MKVLHINYALERGGIETWLERLVRHFGRGDYDFALAYHRGGSDSMAADLRAAGVELLRLPSPRSPARYLQAYRGLLREHGPFGAVHSHLNFPGLLMLGAGREGVAARIAQSHVSPALMTAGLVAGGYARVTNRLFLRHMTAGVAVSPDAARTLFGDGWMRNPRVHLEPCGIDLTPYAAWSPGDLRADLGIAADALVIGQVGRFSTEKNHRFTLQVAAGLAARRPTLCLLLVGDGPTRAETTRYARELGLDRHIIYLGERSDVPDLLQQVIDVLLLPSLSEGSPLTVIEAQAAGIPSVVSSAVPQQSILVTEQVEIVGLEQGVTAWASAIDRAAGKGRREDAWRQIAGSSFDIRHNAHFFDACYRGTALPTGTS